MSLLERRAFRRVPSDAVAEISGPGGTWRARVLDLSLGGLKLDAIGLAPATPQAAPRALYEGAMTSVSLFLDNGEPPVHAFAKVRWVAGASSFGAQFLDLEPAARKQLTTYIDRVVAMLDTASHPAPSTPLPSDG
ncbi:MAG: PilZ domain-containing protein [Myxococcales bacterium]|nr:PilZ domain-containing protein [Myxococcales bacterium]